MRTNHPQSFTPRSQSLASSFIPSRKSARQELNLPLLLCRQPPGPLGHGHNAVHTGVDPVLLLRQSSVQSRYTNAPSQSGWLDSNQRSPVPETGGLTRLSYIQSNDSSNEKGQEPRATPGLQAATQERSHHRRSSCNRCGRTGRAGSVRRQSRSQVVCRMVMSQPRSFAATCSLHIGKTQRSHEGSRGIRILVLSGRRPV